MKKLVIALSLVALTLAGCAHPIERDGAKYKPYGIANEQTHRDPNMKYEISLGSVIVAIVFCETIIVPVFVVGWDLYQPVTSK